MLTDKSIRYIIRQLEEGRGAKVVAKEVKASQRHVQRLWAEYLKTGMTQGRRSLECRGGDNAGHPPPLAGRGAVDRQETLEGRMQYEIH